MQVGVTALLGRKVPRRHPVPADRLDPPAGLGLQRWRYRRLDRGVDLHDWAGGLWLGPACCGGMAAIFNGVPSQPLHCIKAVSPVIAATVAAAAAGCAPLAHLLQLCSAPNHMHLAPCTLRIHTASTGLGQALFSLFTPLSTDHTRLFAIAFKRRRRHIRAKFCRCATPPRATVLVISLLLRLDFVSTRRPLSFPFQTAPRNAPSSRQPVADVADRQIHIDLRF